MEWFIPGNVPSSKNSRVWTGKFFVVSKATTQWRKSTKKWWEELAYSFKDVVKDLPKPIVVKFTFIRGTKHKFDYVNPLQTILDEMTHNNWIPDDNADEILPVFGTYQYSKSNPGVLIEI